MSGLPWARLDANIASHDKVVSLLGMPNGYRSFTVYVCGLGWSVGHGTDGLIPKHVLPLIHGTKRNATQLVDVSLWAYESAGKGWLIRNFETRQETTRVTEAKREAQAAGARKANCTRWHGEACECWRTAA